MDFESFFPKDFYKLYLKRFNKKNYAKAFAEYRTAAEPFFRELDNCDDPEAIAAQFVSAANASVTGFAKKRQYSDIQFFLALFASPALSAACNENCTVFADFLQKAWEKSHPDQKYGLVSYEEIANGFSGGIVSTFFTRKEK